MRIKNYADFTNEEISLRKAILGGAIGASAILPSYADTGRPHQPPTAVDTTALDKSNAQAVTDFVEKIADDTPALFIDMPLNAKTKLDFGQYEKITYLKTRADQYSESTGVNLNLNMITHQPELFPFKINYFLARGLDDLDSPTLIEILRVDYTAAIKIGGHEVMFNFTRVQDVNTLGFRVNF